MYVLVGILVWVLLIPVFYGFFKFCLTTEEPKRIWTYRDRITCLSFSSIPPFTLIVGVAFSIYCILAVIRGLLDDFVVNFSVNLDDEVETW